MYYLVVEHGAIESTIHAVIDIVWNEMRERLFKRSSNSLTYT